LFESNQVGDKIENQFKDTNDLKKQLDATVQELKGKIEDVNAETAFKDELQATSRNNMKFLSELIKEFRPRLYPKGGLRPLTDDNAELFLLKLKR
jgi:peptidoglycan hydrolase CwlO-like protein